MTIDISDVISSENREETREVAVTFTSFDMRLGRFPVKEKRPFDLTLINQENRLLKIQGRTELTILIPCDRCLTEVETVFPIEISREVDLGRLTADGEKPLEDTYYIVEKSLDVDQLVFGEILENWPLKVLCSEDCKGICKRCGANLNLTSCGCQKTELDPRMAAIRDIFNQFKEV